MEAIKEAEETKHESVGYVDDLSQVIANSNMMSLQIYIQTTYETSVKYFETNLLAINERKTELMIVPPRNEDDKEAYIMTDEGDIITSVNQVKILGVIFNS